MNTAIAWIALLLSLLALFQSMTSMRFWKQHQWRMQSYKELFEKYGITADYFKRRRTGKNHARETDHDFRERIEKIMDLDNAAAAVRETNATLAKKDKGKPNA